MVKVNRYIEIKDAGEVGLGAFALRDIKSGTLIETNIGLRTPGSLSSSVYERYRFPFYDENNELIAHYLLLGAGSIYNHSDTPNIEWKQTSDHPIYKFYTISDVKKGDQLLHKYNKGYWKNKKPLRLN